MKENIVHAIGWTLIVCAMMVSCDRDELDDLTSEVNQQEVVSRWR